MERSIAVELRIISGTMIPEILAWRYELMTPCSILAAQLAIHISLLIGRHP
jgi:hypothetical protein